MSTHSGHSPSVKQRKDRATEKTKKKKVGKQKRLSDRGGAGDQEKDRQTGEEGEL